MLLEDRDLVPGLKKQKKKGLVWSFLMEWSTALLHAMSK